MNTCFQKIYGWGVEGRYPLSGQITFYFDPLEGNIFMLESRILLMEHKYPPPPLFFLVYMPILG